MSSSPKNIVVCLDGTNNQLGNTPTNVARLFTALKQSSSNQCDCADGSKGADEVEKAEQSEGVEDADSRHQVTYYDAGVGTIAHAGLVNPISKRMSLVFGLAFGNGFNRNLEESYRFIMENYEDGDQIYIYGFSRGAYTARALAGMIHMFGLLRPNQENMLPFITRAYNGAKWIVADQVKEFSRTNVKIHFLGLWDTVSALGWIYKRKALPYTASNPDVKHVRHAVAIDECRAYFRQNLWKNEDKKAESFKEIWFAGVHSDIGGGYPDERGRLSKIPFQWMVHESKEWGLLVDDEKIKKAMNCCDRDYREKDKDVTATPSTCGPNAGAPINRSLAGPWWVLEFLPMNYTLKRKEFFFPLARRRQAPHDAILHQSVFDRIKKHTDKDSKKQYDPYNIVDFDESRAEGWSEEEPGYISPYEKPSFGKKFANCFDATFNISVAFYLLPALAIFLIPVLVSLAYGVIAGRCWPPDWGQHLHDAFTWPATVIDRSVHEKVWLILPALLVFPLAVAARDWCSGLYRTKARVWGPLLHRRALGYDKRRINRQLFYLKEDGREHYRRTLGWRDWVSMVVCFAILGVAVCQAIAVSGGLVTWVIWVALGLAAVANVIEGVYLSGKIKAFKKDDPVPEAASETYKERASIFEALAVFANCYLTLIKIAATRAVLLAVAGVLIAKVLPPQFDVGAHAWLLFVLEAPLVLIVIGSELIEGLSGMSRFAGRIKGTILHRRWATGYHTETVNRHLGHLKGDEKDECESKCIDGRPAYQISLKIDYLFPFLYAGSLIWSLHVAFQLSPRGLFGCVVWLPVLAVIADWIENTLLLKLIEKHRENDKKNATDKKELPRVFVTVASWMTRIKIGVFVASIVLLLYLLLQTVVAWHCWQ